MPWLELTKGLHTEVSDDDFEWACQWKWSASRSSSAYYAVRRQNICRRQVRIYLHREIAARMEGLDYLPSSRVVDHIDRDTLNNKRSNLRACSAKENLANRRWREPVVSRQPAGPAEYEDEVPF